MYIPTPPALCFSTPVLRQKEMQEGAPPRDTGAPPRDTGAPPRDTVVIAKAATLNLVYYEGQNVHVCIRNDGQFLDPSLSCDGGVYRSDTPLKGHHFV